MGASQGRSGEGVMYDGGWEFLGRSLLSHQPSDSRYRNKEKEGVTVVLCQQIAAAELIKDGQAYAKSDESEKVAYRRAEEPFHLRFPFRAVRIFDPL